MNEDELNDDLEPVDLLAGIITGDVLETMTFPPLKWAVPGLIPEGFGLLTGAPKIGKSWLVLDVALAVAAGARVLGAVDAGRPRPVLYLALEDGERRLQGRCRHLLSEGGLIPANLHLLVQAPRAGAVPVIRAWLRSMAGCDPLVVLDTLGRVMPPAHPGEGAYERDYRIGALLKLLTDEHPGSTLLVVHHVRKAVSLDWMDSTSGTNGLNGAADFTVNLSRDRNSDSGALRVTGRDVAEGEYAVTNRDGRWSIDGHDLADAADKLAERAAVAGLGDRSSEIVRFVGSTGSTVSAKDVADTLDLDSDSARVYLNRLVDAGRLLKPSRGRYSCVTSVTSVTNEPEKSGNVTDVTHVTPTCMGCHEAMIDLGDGATTHPGCDTAA